MKALAEMWSWFWSQPLAPLVAFLLLFDFLAFFQIEDVKNRVSTLERKR